MLAYSRGSKRLAGAAPLEHRVPATVGSFRFHSDIAQWVEQQLTSCESRVRIPLSATTSNPGLSHAVWAR